MQTVSQFESKLNPIDMNRCACFEPESQLATDICLLLIRASDYLKFQMFTKSLLAKFAWAMDVDPDFRF